jgi:tetratricopeptide (TPR) repeat protein
MTDHVFISYSTADALDFARQLADKLEGGEDKYINAWFDKRDINPARDWDEQIVEGIKTCKCMAFVMTKDSTAPTSMCKNEWTWGLKYKKIIIPIRLHKDAEQPFGLGNRQWIDFSDNFEHGLAKLRIFLREMDSPKGILHAMQDRLADAERALRRAKGDEEKRIQVEIEELRKQIETQQRVVDNPKAAAEQTQKNIEAGLERERRPEKETKSKETSTKFINPPPGVAPNYFQDRQVETNEIVKFLNDDAQTMMTIVGRGGVGKTAMVCRLLKGLEGGELPDGLGKMRAEGIVYLSESGSHRVNFANLFYDLCKLLPSDAAQELDAVYKNPQGSTESKMRTLLEKFAGGRVVLLLDNFEPLVDTETFAIRDAELDEALRAFLNGTHTAVNIVITTRVAPRALNLIQPGRQRVLTLDEGLESPYAENILREMDSDGRLGLQSATEELLKHAKEKTRGFPRALEALFAILASDRYTTLEELLAMPLPENVVEALVGEAFNRLDTNAQKVMQALAVYNRPVTPAAVDYLLAPHLPAIDSAPILQRLANMHFARKESGRFYLHPVDREFTYNLIPEGEKTLEEPEDFDFDDELEEDKTEVEEEVEATKDEFEEDDDNDNDDEKTSDINFDELDDLLRNLKLSRTDFTRYGLLDRAADFFAKARKPRAEWKKLDDLTAQLAEFELRCEAGDYDTAADVLTDIDFNYLLLWGHYRMMIDLHEKLQGKINDKVLARISIGSLGQALAHTGSTNQAISNYKKAIAMAKEVKNREAEGVWLGNLGTVNLDLVGDVHKAIEYFGQSLAIAREVRNRTSERIALGNLGESYEALGDINRSIEFHEQNLIISRDIGDLKGEGYALENLGIAYANLGDTQKATNFLEQSIKTRHEIGHAEGIARSLESIGWVFLENKDYKNAKKNFEQAIQIADEILFLIVRLNARWSLAQTYLVQNDLVNAYASINAALQYDVPKYNHNVTALHGIIALRQGERATAGEAFMKSIAQADEILAKTPDYYSALDAKGLALCGSALCRSRLGRDTGDAEETSRYKRDLQDAIETFRKARKIAPHAGVVKATLRLLDELVKCDTEGILKDVRKAAEGVENA